MAAIFAMISSFLAAIPATILSFFKNITVEPIGFLAFIFLNINRMAVTIFVMDAVCLQNYENDPTVDCKNQSTEVELDVQAGAMFWVTWTIVVSMPLAMVANLIFGNVFALHIALQCQKT